VAGLSRWTRAWLLTRVVIVRLRFIALFVAVGVTFAYWDTLSNYYAKWMRPSPAAVGEAGYEYYCAMHPQVLRDAPGICPLCAMNLSKRKKSDKPPSPPGVLARVSLTPWRTFLAGVRTEPVTYRPLHLEVRAAGVVDVDERRLERIAARVAGRVEKLHVDFTGRPVVRGTPLVDLYSPELNVAVEELRIAYQAAQRNSSDRLAAQMLQQSEDKLRLLGITPEQIEALKHSGAERPVLTIVAPQAGIVLQKHVVAGQYVEEGTPLYEIADLSSLWLQAYVFEDDLPLLQVGQPIVASSSAYPGRQFPGTVAFIDPVVQRETRTARVRFDIPNDEGLLRPGMFLQATLQVPLTEIAPFRERVAMVRLGPEGTDDASLIEFQKVCPVQGLKLGWMGPPVRTTIGQRVVFLCCKACLPEVERDPQHVLARVPDPNQMLPGVLSVPAESVIDTGTRHVVYRESEPHVFDAVEVVLGPRVGDAYAVLDGLSPGDRVAAAGAFLIDAETRLDPHQATMYFGASDRAAGAAAPAARGHQH
jgi:Cu(I)/Ag(I) efflux system membrane fusion protein